MHLHASASRPRSLPPFSCPPATLRKSEGHGVSARLIEPGRGEVVRRERWLRSERSGSMRLLVLGLCVFALAGCAVAPSGAPAPPPAPVTVSYPAEREVTDHADFTARTAAVDSVD